MNALKRLIELEHEIEATGDGLQTKMSEEQILEFRTLRTFRNVLTSKTGHSFVDRECVKYIAKRLGMNVNDFKVGKFHYE